MFKPRKPKRSSLLGVDINASSVQILEIASNENTLCVESYGYSAVPAGSFQGTAIKDIEAVAQSIKQAYSLAGSVAKQAAIALPNSVVINRVIQISSRAHAAEIKELAIIEAGKCLAHPLHVDFQHLRLCPKKPDFSELLIVASESEYIHHRIEALAKAGLEAVIVDVESYAIRRAAQQCINNQTLSAGTISAWINIEQQAMQAFIFQGMELIDSREEALGSVTDYREKTGKELWLKSIQRIMQFFYSSELKAGIDCILLSGTLAQNPSVSLFIQEQSPVPTQIINPLSHELLSNKVDYRLLRQSGASLLTAYGLALRNRPKSSL